MLRNGHTDMIKFGQPWGRRGLVNPKRREVLGDQDRYTHLWRNAWGGEVNGTESHAWKCAILPVPFLKMGWQGRTELRDAVCLQHGWDEWVWIEVHETKIKQGLVLGERQPSIWAAAQWRFFSVSGKKTFSAVFFAGFVCLFACLCKNKETFIDFILHWCFLVSHRNICKI